MNRLLLPLLAFVLAGLAAYTVQSVPSGRFAAGDDLPRLAFPVFDPAAAARIIITLPRFLLGVEEVELVRRPEGWTAASQSDFPADEAKIARLLAGLAALELRAQRTDEAQYYSRLGTGAPEDLGAAIGVRVLGALNKEGDKEGDKELAAVLLGRPSLETVLEDSGEFYLRFAAEKTSWLAAGLPLLPAEPSFWLDLDVLPSFADAPPVAARSLSGGAAGSPISPSPLSPSPISMAAREKLVPVFFETVRADGDFFTPSFSLALVYPQGELVFHCAADATGLWARLEGEVAREKTAGFLFRFTPQAAEVFAGISAGLQRASSAAQPQEYDRSPDLE